MKKIFIGAKIKNEPDYEKIKEIVNKKITEKKIAVCYSNQFIEVAKKISDKLNKKVVQTIQILGCSNPHFSKEVEAILLIGQGKFHSVSIAYESKLPTYILENETIEKISEKEVQKMEQKEKGMYLKYLHSEKIGILVTNKPGQQRLKNALRYLKSLKEKKGYIFISNDLNTKEFENFQINCWVNTACPRMDLTDGEIINLEKLQRLEKLNSR